MQANAILDVEVRHLASTRVSNLQTEFGDQVLLVVNTASKCAYTPQLRELETLHNRYSQEDFSVLGFPSNDFASQDPGTEAQIADVCYVNYGVTFPMFEKISVKKTAKKQKRDDWKRERKLQRKVKHARQEKFFA